MGGMGAKDKSGKAGGIYSGGSRQTKTLMSYIPKNWAYWRILGSEDNFNLQMNGVPTADVTTTWVTEKLHMFEMKTFGR